jgi:hypothetical protein
MVDFSKLLSKPLDDIAKPKPLPVGTYTGVISAYEYKESNNEKKTPYVRFSIKVTGATDDIDSSDLDGVDVAKKLLRKDFYLTDDAQYRVKEFLESAGISTSGRSLGETIPDAVNLPVLVGVTQRSGQDGTEIYNDVNTLTGA